MADLMKAVVIEAPGKIGVQEAPLPEVAPGEVLIRIDYCLICTWEQRIFSGASSMKLPFIPGHEASGVVVEVHPDTITSFRAGDQVVFKTLDHCGHCTYCYQGDTNQCTGTARKRFYGGIPGSGGFAQYISLVPERIFHIPGSIPLHLAAFTEPVACCLHSVKRGKIAFGETVVVIGAGIMGQLHALLARLQGARVIVVEPRSDRRALSERLGAHYTLDPQTDDVGEAISSLTAGEGADVVFLTASDPSIAEETLAYARKGGRYIYYGSFHPNRKIAVDPNHIHYSEVILTGSSGPATVDFFQAVRMLGYGLLPIEHFLTKIYPLDCAAEALQASISPDTYRVAIKLNEGGDAIQDSSI
jgi:2-desacetyl-2-hydroxyethyl bacteriochlorophyllide A dehydrogenase